MFIQMIFILNLIFELKDDLICFFRKKQSKKFDIDVSIKKFASNSRFLFLPSRKSCSPYIYGVKMEREHFKQTLEFIQMLLMYLKQCFLMLSQYYIGINYASLSGGKKIMVSSRINIGING